MKYSKHYLIILFCFFSLNLIAQKDNQVQSKKHRFSIYGGAGPNYYFNNLVTARKDVQPWNYSLVARIMWEPEHFIGLGFESGYYQLYKVNYTETSMSPAQVTNIAIPIQLVVSMKFLKNYYADLSVGQTSLLNKLSNTNMGDVKATSWSLADFGVTLGYKYHIGERLSLGAETKFFYSTKNNDSNLALVVVAAFNF
jgi:hypothetical protein